MSQEKTAHRYPSEIREQVLAACDAGLLRRRAIAEQYGVTYAVVQYWVSQRRKEQQQNSGFVRIQAKKLPTGPRLVFSDNLVLHLDGCDAQYVADIARALTC